VKPETGSEGVFLRRSKFFSTKSLENEKLAKGYQHLSKDVFSINVAEQMMATCHVPRSILAKFFINECSLRKIMALANLHSSGQAPTSTTTSTVSNTYHKTTIQTSRRRGPE
jgi:hypothetical protein